MEHQKTIEKEAFVYCCYYDTDEHGELVDYDLWSNPSWQEDAEHVSAMTSPSSSNGNVTRSFFLSAVDPNTNPALIGKEWSRIRIPCDDADYFANWSNLASFNATDPTLDECIDFVFEKTQRYPVDHTTPVSSRRLEPLVCPPAPCRKNKKRSRARERIYL